MAKNSNAWILIVLVVAAILLVPMGVGSLTNAWNKGWGDFWGLFNNLASGGNYTGGASVNFKVVYTDGSSKDFSVQPSTFNIMPLIITVEGKEISMVTMYVEANLQGTGDVTAWQTKTSLQIELYKKPEVSPKTSATSTIDNSGTKWVSGETKRIAERGLTWQQIDDVVKSHGDADWLLQVNVSVELTATLAGKTVTSKASAPSGGIDFHYQEAADGITSFTVTVNSKPLYP